MKRILLIYVCVFGVWLYTFMLFVDAGPWWVLAIPVLTLTLIAVYAAWKLPKTYD